MGIKWKTLPTYCHRILNVCKTSGLPGVVIHWDVHILYGSMLHKQLPQIIAPGRTEKQNSISGTLQTVSYVVERFRPLTKREELGGRL